MSFVDIFKTLFYLERADQSSKLREYTGFCCTENNLVSKHGNYIPIPIADVSYRQIKIRWPNLCKAYNIPYTIVYGCERYLTELLTDKKTTIISESEPPHHGIFCVTIRYEEAIYRIATYCGKVIVINSQEIPLVPALTARNIQAVKLQYDNHELHISTDCPLSNNGMIVYYDAGAYKDIATLLSGDLCVVAQDKLQMDVAGVLSDTSKNATSFEYDRIHAILEDKNDIGDRYKKLITALRCLDANLPGKLQAILDSMEE